MPDSASDAGCRFCEQGHPLKDGWHSTPAGEFPCGRPPSASDAELVRELREYDGPKAYLMRRAADRLAHPLDASPRTSPTRSIVMSERDLYDEGYRAGRKVADAYRQRGFREAIEAAAKVAEDMADQILNGPTNSRQEYAADALKLLASAIEGLSPSPQALSGEEVKKD